MELHYAELFKSLKISNEKKNERKTFHIMLELLIKIH